MIGCLVILFGLLVSNLLISDVDAITCPPNEVVYECANAVCKLEKCSDVGNPIRCAVPIVSHCEPGCYCKDGYFRNESGHCITEKECNPVTCLPNEVENECANAVCKREKCSDVGNPLPCTVSIIRRCERGCNCKDGYFRNESGLCIPEKECTPITCPPNEVVNWCANAYCKIENCSDRGKPVVCAQVHRCERGCNCKDSYLRNESGLCIPEKECKPIIDNPKSV